MCLALPLAADTTSSRQLRQTATLIESDAMSLNFLIFFFFELQETKKLHFIVVVYVVFVVFPATKLC